MTEEDRNIQTRLTLVSGSPQRHELLRQLIGEDRLAIESSLAIEEPGFDDCTTLAQIDSRLLETARLKNQHARSAAHLSQADWLLTADTIIVAFDSANRPLVLLKPPADDPEYTRTLRHWFTDYYTGRSHQAKTALWLTDDRGGTWSQVVTTEVRFRADSERFLDWYIATGEPRGKAGGYGIQGAGSRFVESLTGSLSNVIGLPLVETHALLQQAGFQL
jgi:septum formation protein